MAIDILGFGSQSSFIKKVTTSKDTKTLVEQVKAKMNATEWTPSSRGTDADVVSGMGQQLIIDEEVDVMSESALRAAVGVARIPKYMMKRSPQCDDAIVVGPVW